MPAATSVSEAVNKSNFCEKEFKVISFFSLHLMSSGKEQLQIVLAEIASQQPERIKHAEELLRSWEKIPEFYVTLQVHFGGLDCRKFSWMLQCRWKCDGSALFTSKMALIDTGERQHQSNAENF